MKLLVSAYIFDHSAGTITFPDYGSIDLDHLLVAFNVTSNILIYNFSDPALGGSVATNVLTLNYDTSAMNNGDALMIYYDDPDVTASTGENQLTEISFLSSMNTAVSDVASQTTLALIKAKTDNLDTALSGIKTGTDKIISAPATAANQATEITGLASIDSTLGTLNGKVTAVNTGAVVLAAGTAVVGKVSIDQTTPGTTDKVSISTAQGAGATVGVTTGAAVITDADGTLQQYLRGLVKLVIAKVGITIADGDSATTGVTTGAAVVTDATGTLQQYLRGIVKIFADIWDSTNHWFAVKAIQKDTYAATVAFTITLNSLASSTAGVGRQSTLLTSNTNRAALVYVKLKMGTSPTANTPLYVYLLQGDGTIAADAAGASDAVITIINAPVLGVINCNAVTTGNIYYGVFDTRTISPALGPQWGVAIVNSSGVALDASAGGTIDYVLVS